MALGTKRKASNILAQFPVNFPSGTIIAFAGATAPEGWALCDGSTASRTEYSALYAAIGNAWGSGDGSTTFHLPDLRGRFLRGVDGAAGNDPDAGSRTAANAGGNAGDAVGSVQDDELGSHDHDIRVENTVSDGGNNSHVHTGYYSNYLTNTTSIFNRGGNESRPKNANVNYIIKL